MKTMKLLAMLVAVAKAGQGSTATQVCDVAGELFIIYRYKVNQFFQFLDQV